MYCSQPIVHMLRRGDTLYQLSRYYQTTIQDILDQNPHINPFNLPVGMTLVICPGERFVMRPGRHTPSPKPEPSLDAEMRKAWEQHVYWTRMLLISIAERLEDLGPVTAQLLKNPADVANLFADYYPPEATIIIERLLTEHLQIGAALITALRDGNAEQADMLTQQWYRNAAQLADAFADLNPFYSREDLHNMLVTHLDLTTREVALRLAGRYQEDIDAFDAVEREALMMADYLSNGIKRQFS